VRTVIGYGTFRPRKNAHVHLYGPRARTTGFTALGPMCEGSKWTHVVRNDWGDLYHDHATPQEAAQASVRPVTCPECLRHA
jgi:hypothetical protein